MQHIGIVGCSAEGAALCYRTICLESAKLLGNYQHPEVSMHTHSLGTYVELLEANDWNGVGSLMLSSSNKLAAAGANFIVCPDNTIHGAFPTFYERSPIPWLHIAEVVARDAFEKAYKRVGLLGTRWLLESAVYPEYLAKYGIEPVLPNAGERNEIDRIIMDELVHGTCSEDGIVLHQRVIKRMKSLGCDAVVLACTEIPLIIGDRNSTLPTLDSTRLLARAALRRAIARE